MSTTWFTSDLHLGHEFVAGLRGFDSVEDHDARLTEAWDLRVSDRDTIYVLGDVAVGKLDDALRWVNERPGTKVLIAGNHDACHPMHRKWRAQTKRYLQVFDAVGTQASVRIGGERVMLSHFPYDADREDPPRYMEWRLRDEGRFLLHGHTHSKEKWTSEREIHVGVDAWGLGPVNSLAIESIVNMEMIR